MAYAKNKVWQRNLPVNNLIYSIFNNFQEKKIERKKNSIECR